MTDVSVSPTLGHNSNSEVDMGVLGNWFRNVADTIVNESKLRQEVAELREQVQSLAQHVQALEDENTNLHLQLEQTQTERDEARQTIVQLTEEGNTVKAAHESLEQSHATLNGNYDTLCGVHASLQEDHAKLRQEHTDMIVLQGQTVQQRDYANAELEDLRNKHTKLTDDYHALLEQHQDTVTRCEAHAKRLNAVQLAIAA